MWIGHSQKDRKLVFKTNYGFMQVKSIAECSKGSILQYFWPSLSYLLSLRSLFCLFLSGHFTQVLLYCQWSLENGVTYGDSILFCFVWFDSLRPINNLSVKQGWVFLGWTSTNITVDNHVTCGQWANRMLQWILMKNQYILAFWRWVTSIFSWFYTLFAHHLLIPKHIRSCEWSCL